MAKGGGRRRRASIHYCSLPLWWSCCHQTNECRHCPFPLWATKMIHFDGRVVCDIIPSSILSFDHLAKLKHFLHFLLLESHGVVYNEQLLFSPYTNVVCHYFHWSLHWEIKKIKCWFLIRVRKYYRVGFLVQLQFERKPMYLQSKQKYCQSTELFHHGESRGENYKYVDKLNNPLGWPREDRLFTWYLHHSLALYHFRPLPLYQQPRGLHSLSLGINNRAKPSVLT